MKTKILLLITMAALAGLPSLTSAQGRKERQDRQDRRFRRSMNFNSSIDKITNCGDLQITFDRRPAITEETELILPVSQVSTLRSQTDNNGMFVGGWDRNEYSVKTLKAVPDDDSNATATLRAITTTNLNGQISISGPTDREWTANFIIMVRE